MMRSFFIIMAIGDNITRHGGSEGGARGGHEMKKKEVGDSKKVCGSKSNSVFIPVSYF